MVAKKTFNLQPMTLRVCLVVSLLRWPAFHKISAQFPLDEALALKADRTKDNTVIRVTIMNIRVSPKEVNLNRRIPTAGIQVRT
jgi:hypothetical protein